LQLLMFIYYKSTITIASLLSHYKQY